MASTLNLYKTYSFKDKDPAIDQLRTIMDDLGARYGEISDSSGVSDTCLRGWFEGKTRRPQHATLTATARALGFDYKLVRSQEYKFHSKEPRTVKKERQKLQRQATSTIRQAKKRQTRKRPAPPTPAPQQAAE